MSKVLEQKLREKSLPEAADAAKIVALVNQAIDRTRELSRGLLPVLSDARGLMSALERLALEVEDLFQVSCRFECDQPVLIRESDIATHLYHIAQEAVNNALRARPSAAHRDSAGGRREIFPECRRRWSGHSRFEDCCAGRSGDGAADHGLPGEDDRRRAGGSAGSGRGRDLGVLYVSGEPSGKGGGLMTPQYQVVSAVKKADDPSGGRSPDRAPGSDAAHQPGAGSGGLRRRPRMAAARSARLPLTGPTS